MMGHMRALIGTTMAQNIYDDPQFFEGYRQLPRSQKGLDGAPEWQSLRALLPDMRGLEVVDLGCGYGWFSRWARDHHAQHVLALDVSVRMLAEAAASGTTGGITYERADLEQLQLPVDTFDLAYSSLALHYIKDLSRLFTTVYASLKPGGRLVFSIEHPIYMAPTHPAWRHDDQGNRYWPLDNYQAEGARKTNWLAPDVIKYHRTMGTLLNQLIQAGFTLAHIEEWGPSQTQLDAQPALAEETHRPMMLLVAADKTSPTT